MSRNDLVAKFEAKLRKVVSETMQDFEDETNNVMNEKLEDVVYSYTNISERSLLARRRENGGLKDKSNRDIEIKDNGRNMVFTMYNRTKSACKGCDDVITGIVEDGYRHIPSRPFMKETQEEMNRKAKEIVKKNLIKNGFKV